MSLKFRSLLIFVFEQHESRSPSCQITQWINIGIAFTWWSQCEVIGVFSQFGFSQYCALGRVLWHKIRIFDISNPFNCEGLNQILKGYYSGGDNIVVCPFFWATQTLSYRVYIIEYISYPYASKLTATSSLKPFILFKKKRKKKKPVSLKKRS